MRGKALVNWMLMLYSRSSRRNGATRERGLDRRKYDAARTLATFSAALRNKVDLSQLSEHLLNVVEQAMQPTHVSLWLRPPQQTAKQQGQSTSNFREQ